MECAPTYKIAYTIGDVWIKKINFFQKLHRNPRVLYEAAWNAHLVRAADQVHGDDLIDLLNLICCDNLLHVIHIQRNRWLWLTRATMWGEAQLHDIK